MYNSEVGYCQGMSTLAGMLLMYLGEEETFWALNILLADKKVRRTVEKSTGNLISIDNLVQKSEKIMRCRDLFAGPFKFLSVPQEFLPRNIISSRKTL
jgi:hypothetical protein